MPKMQHSLSCINYITIVEVCKTGIPPTYINVCAGHETLEEAMICHDRATNSGLLPRMLKDCAIGGAETRSLICKEMSSVTFEEMDT